MRIVTILLALTSTVIGCNAQPVDANRRVVATGAQLSKALAAAKGGERIVLRPGNYGSVVVEKRSWQRPVTIESADPARPATIGKFLAVDTSGLTLRDIEFTRPLGDERVWSKIVQVNGGANIRFEGGSIHGTLDSDPSNDMQGLAAHATRNLVITRVKFQDLNLGLICDDCTDFDVSANDFSFLGNDAMDIPGARGATIAKNFFHDFRSLPGAHADAIQCWTVRKASGCKDVTITGNTFRGDPGHEFQGVFFGDEAKVGGYDRILIANNIFTCTLWHAVNIARGSDIQITDNEIVAGPNYKPWFRTYGSARLTGNIAPAYFIENRQGVPPGNRLGGAYKK